MTRPVAPLRPDGRNKDDVSRPAHHGPGRGAAGRSAASPAWAGVPTDQLRAQIDRVIKTVDDPEPEAERQGRRAPRRRPEDRQRDLRFPGDGLARPGPPLAAPHPRGARRVREALRRPAGARLRLEDRELYGARRSPTTATPSTGTRHLVKTKIVTKQGTDIPVDYRMLKRSDRWLVYDVVIEGVSLINNYRTQFNKIIQTSSYLVRIERMKNKQNELIEDDREQEDRSRPPGRPRRSAAGRARMGPCARLTSCRRPITSGGAPPRGAAKGEPVTSLRVAIIGVGNCASALVQGVQYYRHARRRPLHSRPHAPPPRRLSRGRHRILGGLRHRRGQGRARPPEAVFQPPTTP